MIFRYFVRGCIFSLLLTWAHSAFAVDALSTLPPALRAAVVSGTGSQIKTSITTLSGGNPTQVANLSLSTANAAEQMLTSNPWNALIAASAALESVQPTIVMTAAPTQIASIVTTVTRIFISPVSRQVAPTTVASLASLAINVAAGLSNASLLANTAQQAVAAAETIANTLPANAISLASVALTAISPTYIALSAPAQVAATAIPASRIALLSDVIAVSPTSAASVALAAVRVLSVPVVYQTSSTAALQSFANAYAVVYDPAVVAAVPAARSELTTLLVNAAQSPELNAANGSTATQINTILAATSTPTASTGLASSISNTSATFNGTISSNGGFTTVTFEYGVSDSYGSTVIASESPLSSAATATQVSAAVTGLTCNSTYHFRVKAVNSSGSTYGNDATLTTATCPPVIDITTQPVGGLDGSALTVQPIITIKDGNGNTLTASTVAVTASILWGAGGTLGGNTTVNAVNGVATFTNLTLSGTVGEPYVLQFTSAGLISDSSNNIYVTSNQTITFTNPGSQNFGTTPVIPPFLV